MRARDLDQRQKFTQGGGLKVAFYSPDVRRRAKACYSQAVLGTATHPTDPEIGCRSPDAVLASTRHI